MEQVTEEINTLALTGDSEVKKLVSIVISQILQKISFQVSDVIRADVVIDIRRMRS